MCAECDCGSAWFPGLTLEHCIWAEGLCRHPGPPFTFSGHQQLLGGLPFVDVFCEVKVILSCIENLTSLSYMRPLSKRKEEKRKEEGRGDVQKRGPVAGGSTVLRGGGDVQKRGPVARGSTVLRGEKSPRLQWKRQSQRSWDRDCWEVSGDGRTEAGSSRNPASLLLNILTQHSTNSDLSL